MFAILPLEGVGPVFLGMSRDEVVAVLGHADKTQVMSYADDSTEEGWEYLLAGLDLSFSSDHEWRLIRITIRRSTAMLRNEKLIGISEAELHEVCYRLGYPLDLSFELLEGGLNLREWKNEESSLSFWLEDGAVASVAIMPLYDTTGNVPIWPVDGSGNYK